MGLFRTTVNNQTTNKHPEKVYIEENRSPTDDSIRLANEFEEKIHSQIAERLIVNNNLFTYTLSFSVDSFSHNMMHVKIKINGNDFSDSFRLDSFESLTPEYAVNVLRNWLCEKVLMDPISNIFQCYAMGNNCNYRFIDNKFTPRG